ncbi:MAG: aminotransferase class I/II-fold pyridoxal phosphate-dependent enzyme [Candidatus Moranbacteria bacterium]|nr:aminotransferase class I/II-fold pyridoxal phosphate-dependent enzyme [Candidatus Moranbacteria bacterium]
MKKQRQLVYKNLKKTDRKVFDLIEGELERQKNGLEMIPSESYASRSVLEAMGSIFNNKYSEGFPKKRYYGGQEYTDKIEGLAIKRAKDIFKMDHVNVQPYSGSPANLAVYFALCRPGDKIMGMELSQGGHITHGLKINFSGTVYRSVTYGVGKDGLIDFDQVEKMLKKHRPKLMFSGATAYPREYDFKRFGQLARKYGTFFIADISHIIGLIIGKVHQSPVDHADVITSTTHKTLRGPRAGIIMCNGNPSNPLKPVKEVKKENIPSLIDRAIFPGLQGGPHEHTIAAIAVALKEAKTKEFKKWAAQVVKNAKKLAQVFMERGFNLVTGGTDNHLILMDVTAKKINGARAEKLIEKIGISVNKNTIPNDPRPPYSPSGIRLGSPCATIRGMKEKEMEILANSMADVLENPKDKKIIKKSEKTVRDLCKAFPVYPKL